ncbi:hypothetical protein ABFA07_011901 [Porites harrisoni]
MDSKHLLAIVTLWLTVSYFLVHRAEGFIYRRMRRNEKGRQQRKGSRNDYSSVKKMVFIVSNSWTSSENHTEAKQSTPRPRRFFKIRWRPNGKVNL